MEYGSALPAQKDPAARQAHARFNVVELSLAMVTTRETAYGSQRWAVRPRWWRWSPGRPLPWRTCRRRGCSRWRARPPGAGRVGGGGSGGRIATPCGQMYASGASPCQGGDSWSGRGDAEAVQGLAELGAVEVLPGGADQHVEHGPGRGDGVQLDQALGVGLPVGARLLLGVLGPLRLLRAGERGGLVACDLAGLADGDGAEDLQGVVEAA